MAFGSKQHQVPAQQYLIKPGYIYLPRDFTVISAVLGSCVAVCLYDNRRKIAGMNHFQYPRHEDGQAPTARYGDISTAALIKMIIDIGADKKHLEAQIFGGAHNQEISDQNIGRENYRVARSIISRRGLRIVSEDIGGERGRKIIFDTRNNEVAVLKTVQLRREDWYPYESDR